MVQVRDTRAATTALVIGGGIAGPAAAMFLQRAGIEAGIYEARPATGDEAGAWLNLGPNGVNVLRTLGIDIEHAADGVAASGIDFFNGDGRQIGASDWDDEAVRFGARSVAFKRSRLHRALRDEAIRRAIPVAFGKRLVEVAENGPSGVVARFEDGSAARGDILLACDGIHSRIRREILPDAPLPAYTGLIGSGGISRLDLPRPRTPRMRMVFGRHAFFGYLPASDGEVWWFDNVPRPTEPDRQELRPASPNAWRTGLLELHADQPDPVPAILAATVSEPWVSGTYDLPFLPTWHVNRVCLLGDAAHATSPHAGQGASMALEDAIVIAKCLRDQPDPEAAFVAFERQRKERVEWVVATARRVGNQKVPTNPVALWLRDRMMPVFLRLGTGANARVSAYRVDWDAAAA